MRRLIGLIPALFRTDLALLSVASVAMLSACATLGSGPAAYTASYMETGNASWYGPGFHGRRAANGEVYDQHALTAAHRHLPFGTLVEVTRRDTGHRVVVRITDRGPFVRGRIIDLSKEAARRLDSIGPGVVPVRLRIVAVSDEAGGAGGGPYTIQLGRFQDPERARLLMERLQPRIPGLRMIAEASAGTVRVVTQPYDDYGRAAKVAYRIRRDLQSDAFVVQERLVYNQ